VPNSTREGEVNQDVLDEKDAQQMMNGDMNIVVMAPTAYESRLRGMPNVYVWPDMNKHDARYSVTAGAGDGRIPRGPSWVEVGGTPVELEEWFGGLTKSDDHPLRFNGKALGVYAVAVNTSKGEVVIRRPSMPGGCDQVLGPSGAAPVGGELPGRSERLPSTYLHKSA
jgi:hypothetical protein